MRVWDSFLTEADKKVFGGSGYGAKAGFGEKPAIIIVDVSYGFCGEKPEPVLESIKTWRNSCGAVAWDAVPHIQNLLKVARERHIPVIYTTGIDSRPDRFDRGGWDRKNNRSSEEDVIESLSGNKILEEIAPIESDIVIEKLKPSAFHGTPLLGYLVDLGVDTVIVCGTTTSGCVRATVIDGFSHNFKMSVIEECSFDRGEASHAISLFDMNAKYADVVSIDETVDYLNEVEKGLYDHRIKFKDPIMQD